MISLIVGVLIGAAGLFLAYRNRAALKAQVTKIEGSASAFAKVAELDGKLIALRAVADVKRVEANAVHASLDELHNLLG